MVTAALLAENLLNRLPERLRDSAVLMLVVLALLGLALMALAWLGGRHVRRLARNRPPVRPREQSDWDRKQPLSPGDDLSDLPS